MPPSSSPVLDAERRARSYWYIDGLPQIVGGVALLLFATLLWLFLRWPISNVTIGFILLLTFLAITFRAQQILEWVKSRVTYPRTGYAAVPPLPPPDNAFFYPPGYITQLQINAPKPETASDLRRARALWLRAWLGSLPAGTVVFLWDIKTRWVCLAVAILFSLPFWFAEDGEKNIHWIMVLGVPFVGLCMSLFPVSPHHRIAELVAGLGILAVIDGAITLIRYLRRNPVARA